MKVIDDDEDFFSSTLIGHASLLSNIVAMDIRYRALSLGLATIIFEGLTRKWRNFTRLMDCMLSFVKC